MNYFRIHGTGQRVVTAAVAQLEINWMQPQTNTLCYDHRLPQSNPRLSCYDYRRISGFSFQMLIERKSMTIEASYSAGSSPLRTYKCVQSCLGEAA
jgi:hypothetical protein